LIIHYSNTEGAPWTRLMEEGVSMDDWRESV